jgi:hypothetical protein
VAPWHRRCELILVTAENRREEVSKMSRAIRIAVGSAALAAGLMVAGASAANAQVRVRGSFPLPHGRISVNVGGGGYGGYDGYGYDGFPIGGYVPDGYDVYDDPDYGYGFAYEDQWIGCEPRGNRWIIIAAPVFYGGHRSYGYGGGYRSYGYGGGYRNYGYGGGYRNYGYVRPYSNRYYSRDNRYSSRDRNWGRNDRNWSRNDRTWSRNDRSGSRNDRTRSRNDRNRSGNDRRSGDRRWHN